MARLTETTLNEGLPADAVDAEAGVIRGVALLGPVSANERDYTARAMADAVRLYEGRPVCIDHPASAKRRDSLRESIGTIRSPRLVEGKVRGDFHYLTKHPDAPLIAERAQRMPDTFGFSHVAEGETRQVNGRTVVESLSRVESLDLVLRPATNDSLFESEDRSVSKPKPRKITVAKLIEAAKDSEGGKALARLVEMDAVAADAPMELPPVAPDGDGADAEPDGADDAKEAVKQLVGAIIERFVSGDIDQSEALKRIKAALGVVDETQNTSAADTADTADASGPDSAVAESVQKITAELNALKAKNLLLESGREATPERVKAVARCDSDKERKSLVESWQPKDAVKGATRPSRSPSRFSEAEADAGDPFQGVLPGGKPAWERAAERAAK